MRVSLLLCRSNSESKYRYLVLYGFNFISSSCFSASPFAHRLARGSELGGKQPPKTKKGLCNLNPEGLIVMISSLRRDKLTALSI